MPYAGASDLLVGDITLASKYGDGSTFVQLAADEIDSQIGHIYMTPVSFPTSPPEDVAAARPALLLLKKINTLLASGRLVLDMAAGGEDVNLHAYGRNMLQEALGLLEGITSGKILLIGATKLTDAADDPNTAVSIAQEDSYSLVKGFYDNYSWPAADFPSAPLPVLPYDTEAR